MFPQMPVLRWDAAPTGVYKMAIDYADCRSQLGPQYDVEPETATSKFDENCGPLRTRLQEEIDGLENRFGEVPKDGPVVVFIRALALLGIVSKGKLKFL